MQTNKEFTTLEPCKIVSCRNIVCPQFAYCFSKGSNYNEGSMNITCKPGYELANNVATTNLKCSWNGLWIPSGGSRLPEADSMLF